MFLRAVSRKLVWLAVNVHRLDHPICQGDSVVHLRFKSRSLFLITGLVGMLIVACGGDAPSVAPTVAATSTTVVVAVTPTSVETEPTATTVSAGLVDSDPPVVVFKFTDRSIDTPEFIPAGLTTIRLQNDGSVKHSLTLVRASKGRTADELETITKYQNFPAGWAPTVASIEADAGESNEFTARLAPGFYGVADWGSGADSVPYTVFGLYSGFEVLDSDSADVAWDSERIEIGLSDFHFTGVTDLKAGRHNFRLVNESDKQMHELVFVPLDDGQVVGELFADYRYVKFGGEEVGNLERATGIGWIGAGREIEYSVDLAAGEYAVVCLLPTGFPGEPHVNLGMMGQITVSE